MAEYTRKVWHNVPIRDEDDEERCVLAYLAGGWLWVMIDRDHSADTDFEWIEYIPPDALVERDGDLWWRHYDGESDTFHYTQITKGSVCALPWTQTESL